MKTSTVKIIALLLAAAMCASFAGCSQADQPEDADGSSSGSQSAEDKEESGAPEGDGNGGEENGGTDTSEDSSSAEESTEPEKEPESEGEDGMPDKEMETETSVITTEEEQQPGASDKGDAIAKTAESVVGYEFLMGGDSPEEGGFDNPGLVYYAVTANGISCPRITREIMNTGSEVSYDELRRGDVVIFKMDDGSEIVFCGVYVGEGKAVMSFSEGIPVKIVDVSTNYYRSTFVKGVRVTG